MTIPQEAVQAAVGAVDEGVNWVAGLFGEKYDNAEEAMKDALTAALPFLQGVKVKALEWRDGYKDNQCTIIQADTLGGFYQVRQVDGLIWLDSIGHQTIYPALEAAKAAAQADYEARILSAIEIPTTSKMEAVAPSTRAQALEEAVRNACMYLDTGFIECPKCGEEVETKHTDAEYTLRAALSSQPVADASFQDRVKPWMLACFGEEISNDKLERSDRFIEEALELVQAIGYSADRAHALVEYVFNRDIGEPHQEVGGVMVTLAALCLASGLDMNKAGEDELARIWTKVEKIRAKQAAKPTGSALPIALSSQPAATEWKTIDSAPKDGTVILVYRDDVGVFTAHYVEEDAYLSSPMNPPEGDFYWFSTCGDDLTGDMPTHWRPLPASPGASE